MVMLPNGKDFKLITSCTGKFSSGLTLPGPGGKGILGRCNCATQIVVGTTSRKVVACSRSSWGIIAKHCHQESRQRDLW